MGVAVYPRLNDLLRAKNLTVAELERQIERRFGLTVDPKTLYRLAHDAPIQRADLEIAGAAAAILGVGLGDLFHLEAIPVDVSDEAAVSDLDSEESQHLAALFARQARGPLTKAEQAELEALVTAYGRRLHERRVREIAQRRGLPVDQARREVAAQFDAALAWWRDFEADPERRRAVVRLAKRRRTKSTA